VSPGYFATLRAAILSGRDFGLRDTQNGRLVAIVSDSFVRHHIPDANPLDGASCWPTQEEDS